ncbi:bacterio-opsin activator domain-containing protein [Halorhabdus salina]|uniref:bacterio-opsin activator domain-containing protein n=1 Tax=Halorhabdus salina TaxID=2750670 RepID=UPI0015EFA979|nr:bacterio-opsin activator domain-containing protein [Halorhabdus salina]
MNLVILASIVLRVLGVGYSLVLLYRSNDRRFAFLTVMLSLMATRQILSAQGSTDPIEELPGLAVSILAVLTVYYLSSYVVEEQRITERLRGFQKAIEHAGHAIFLTDTDGTIEYANPAVKAVTGHDPDEVVGENPRLWKSGEHDEDFYTEMWETIAAGSIWEGEIINRRKSGDLCWVDMTIAPITGEDGEVERYVAVERDVTERKEREVRIADQNDRLERLNNTNEVLRDVNRELVAATSRQEIERSLCDRFARSPLFAAAWVGDPRLVDDNVNVRTRAGIDESTLDTRIDATANYRRVIDNVLDSDEPAFVDADATRLDNPLNATAVVIPLSYQDADYGVLVVESATEDAFAAIDRGVFTELGSTVGDAVNAAESRRTLAAAEVTELEFLVDGATDPLVDLSASLGCSVDLEHVAGDQGDPIAYVSVTGADQASVSSYFDDVESRDGRPLCEYDERCLVRLVVDESAIVPTLARYGATVTGLSVTDGHGRIRAEVSRSNDIRSVVEAVQAAHSELELLAQREQEREAEPGTAFQSSFEESLTDRQLEAARTAFFAGFFEWPRETSGEDVAAIMDITQSTFTQHLRTAQRKLFAALFEDNAVSNT